MTAVDLPAIRALLAGATPGGWAHAQGVTPYVAKRDWVEVQNQATICVEVRPADAAFIAAAPSIVAQLLAKIDAVEAELAATEQRTIEGWGHGGHAVVSVASIRAALIGEASDDGS